MKNLTLKSVLTNTMKGLGHNDFMASQERNLFYYQPTLLLRSAVEWMQLKSSVVKDGLVHSEVVPYDIDGSLDVNMQIIDADGVTTVAEENYSQLPLGRPFYNQGYFSPVAYDHHGQYFGVGMEFPELTNDAILNVRETWWLGDESCAWTRKLTIPIKLSSDALSTPILIYDQNFFGRYLSQTRSFHQALLFNFDINKNYHFKSLDRDLSYQAFGKQSIILPGFAIPRLYALDFLTTSGMTGFQVWNELPNVVDGSYKVQSQVLARQLVNLGILSQADLNTFRDQRGDLCLPVDWWQAAFNLPKFSGCQFAEIDGMQNVRPQLDVHHCGVVVEK